MRNIGLGLFVLSLVAVGEASSFAQGGTDPFENATILSDNGTISGLPAAAMFNVSGGGAGEDGSTTIFNKLDGDHSVNFQTASPVTINAVTLYNAADGNSENGFRGISKFQLFADLDLDNSFETTLIGGYDPTDDGVGDNIPFSTVTAQRFQAVFTGNGPRIRELDAVAAPEPSSLGVIGLISLGLAARRRRETNA